MLGSLWRRAEAARVGVVVPLYNHAAFIAEAVDSILAQGAAVAEIVVIDDGSTDDSAAVMERLARRDRRIRFERQANQGAHATINAALARCSSEVLAILNSDDAFLPGRLARLLAALDANDGADIAASGLQFMDGDGAAIRNEWHENALDYYRGGAGLAPALLNGNFVMTTSNLVFRRAMTARVGPFAALRYAHDLDWLLRAVALGRRVRWVDEPLLRYRIHARNTIGEDHGAVRAEWAMAASAFLATSWDRPDAPPIDWDEAASVQQVLRRHEIDGAVPPIMATLRRHGAVSLDRFAPLQDPAFTASVRARV